ncbi:hypothetical protein IKX12_03765 [Candidatus Saccharibacteria bacterium]|nr:hypothetical protein [Candidatus Saccharibacteria bacterium]
MFKNSKVIHLLMDNVMLICMCVVFLTFAFGVVCFTKVTITRFATRDEAKTATIRAVMELEPELEGASESEVEIDATSILYRGRQISLCDASEILVEKYYDDYCVWNFIALIGGVIIMALISLVGLWSAIGEIKKLRGKQKAVDTQSISQPLDNRPQ